MRDCILRPKKTTRLPGWNNVTAETAAQRCRECRGCWEWRECRKWRQRMPRLRRRMSADIAETTEIAEIAENADIGKITEIAETVARDCRDYRLCRSRMGDCMLRQKKMTRLPDGINVIAESAAKNCRNCDEKCRPTLRRLQRLVRFPRMQILARLPRSPRLSLEIAGITDFAGREWVIACWDWKKWRGCQTGLTWSQSLPPKIAEIAEVAGREESAKFADRICQDCDGECRPTLRRLQRLLRLPRMQILARLPRSPRFSPEIAGSADIAGQEWMIACWDWKNWRGCRMGLPGLEAAAQKCWDCQGCWECRFFSRRLPKVLAKIVEIATEIAGRHCRDCRDCWDCRDWRYFQDCRDRRDCRPRLPGLPTLPVENVWLHAETEKNDEVARRD